ncbi:MAG: histidine kinase [Magnetococcales bacterium]|nr:histidine kinase [Magnetococcales bacterium]
MNIRTRFWSILGLYLLLVCGAWMGGAWQAMNTLPVLDQPAESWLQTQTIYILSVVFLSGAVLAKIWLWLDTVLLKPLVQMDRTVSILAHADPLQEISLDNNHLLGNLPEGVQQLGHALYHARRQVKEALSTGADGTERLEKIIKHLHVGLIVINAEAHIILYNAAAQNVFQSHMESLGLGRSLYELCTRQPVETTMEFLLHRKNSAAGSDRNDVRFFCAAQHEEMMLDCVMTLYPGDRPGQNNFILTLEEATRKMSAARRYDTLIRHALENSRNPVASLRAAAETLLQHAEMDTANRLSFMQIIQNESTDLSQQLDAIAAEANTLASEQWILTDVLISDLLATLIRRLAKKSGLVLQGASESLWVRADAPALLLALEKLLQKIGEQVQYGVIESAAMLGDNRIYLDFIWSGSPISVTEVESWRTLILDEEGFPFRLEEVLERHGCEIWSQEHRRPGHAMLRLPLAPSPRQWQYPGQNIPERPDFYDFSLMGSLHVPEHVADRNLADLTFVVFDTETTGLQPSKGDEIISLAGVRIVHGRIPAGETFERLVNPRRPIPIESTRIHGISNADVHDKPALEEVLPQFKAFVADAVLVAHNAAFDMRFLHLKEASCGIHFDNPVLDTLLLSVYLHDEVTDHTLTGIAKRLGVEVREEHRAMGDAMVTAEVFLKLLDLLQVKGITTLGAAIEAGNSMVQIRRQQDKAGY